MKPPGRKTWLADVPWELVEYQNAALCEAKNAHHGPTSDGYEKARSLWETERTREMSLFEVVETCRICHRLAPFTNYNGNTFAAIARTLISRIGLPEDQAAVVRSLAGHIVAGVAQEEEIAEFRKFCDGVDIFS
jgi:hypothetical protein